MARTFGKSSELTRQDVEKDRDHLARLLDPEREMTVS